MSTKKSKKSTLPPPSARPFPRRLVPFRHPDFSDDQIQRLTEGPLISKDRLLRTLRKLDSTAGLLSAPNAKEFPGGPIQTPLSPGSGVAPSDGELLSAMMTRLVWLETKLSESHRQLQNKEKTINDLEEQISIFNQARLAYEGNPVHELEETCLRLQNQIHQMEQFLTDFGVIWAGEKRLSNSSVSTVQSSDADSLEEGPQWNKSTGLGLLEDGNTKVDYDLVIENIHDLNVLAGEGVPQICLSAEGAKFKLVDHVPIALYSNGISLCGGPFRPFTDNTTMQCVQDLMDGYFPSELQRRYPNGVPLKVIDKRNSEFHERLNHSAGNSSPKMLPVPTSRSPSLSPVSPNSPTSPLSGASSPRNSDPSLIQCSPLTVQQLLNALPRAVVRDGRLLDIRHSIAQLLKGSGHSLDIILIHTPVIQHLREGRDVKNITTLRIRSETGSETYLMKLYTTDTIGDIRKYLDLHRSSNSADYDIFTLYPRRVFEKSEETLEDCGLVPNAALHLRLQLVSNSCSTQSQ